MSATRPLRVAVYADNWYRPTADGVYADRSLVVFIVVAIYLLFPQVAGFEDGLAKLGKGDRLWLSVALLSVVSPD